MIVVDTTFLVLLIDPNSTQNHNRRRERVAHFVETASRAKTELMIPAPALAELVAGRAERIEEIVEAIRKMKVLTVQAFDTVIAIETGERIAQALKDGHPENRSANWKVAMKYDAMIAATAVVRGASSVYTNDPGFRKYLYGSPVELMLLDDLPLPPEDPQQRIPFSESPSPA